MGDYDIFQKFPNGSFAWYLCVSGRYHTERKLQELAEVSENEFYAVDTASGVGLQVSPGRSEYSPAKIDAPKRSVA